MTMTPSIIGGFETTLGLVTIGAEQGGSNAGCLIG